MNANRKLLPWLFSFLALLVFVACSEGEVNIPPVAAITDAPEETVAVGTGVITLSGSTSRDADGDSLSYVWALDAPEGSALEGVMGTEATFSFTPDVAGNYEVKLVAEDEEGLTDGATTKVEAVGATSVPVARITISPDETVDVGTEVMLDGSTSGDEEDTDLDYTWALDAPDSSALDGRTGGNATFTFTPDVAGDYTATLTVTDDGGNRDSDTVTVTTREAATGTIRVPQDAPTVQAAVDLAQEGNLILVSPGTYYENVALDKTVTLASLYHTTGDESYIAQTVIDGGGIGDNNYALYVTSSAGSETTVEGLTFQNADDGIIARGRFNLLNSRVTGTVDGLDYEGGGGVVRDSLFEDNEDDAIDLDDDTAAFIEGNILRNNGDDGIEIRLQPYSGPVLETAIRNNVISGNGEDGIQIIGYDGSDPTTRVFRIERNLILNSRDAGLGLMDNAETVEDFRAASLRVRIYLLNNTFVGNRYGVTGGDNLLALNNLFVDSSVLAIKGVNGDSVAAHNLFWNNGEDVESSNVASSLSKDPQLDNEYKPGSSSPAIDVGVVSYRWNGETVTIGSYSGEAPDLGAFEVR